MAWAPTAQSVATKPQVNIMARPAVMAARASLEGVCARTMPTHAGENSPSDS